MDNSPLVLAGTAGDCESRSAQEIYMQEALETPDQCMTLTGEIAQLILSHLQHECWAHGCSALDQLQLLLRIQDSSG
jgi:hypothetical protein